MTLTGRSELERALSSTRMRPRSLDISLFDRRLVAYYRVSTPMQERRGLGLAGQRTAVERFAAKWRGPLVAEYAEAESGRNCQRPNLHKSLGACRVHRATLLIAQIDRLARNVAFIAMLIESGIDFVAADFPLANSINKHIMAAIAEHELKSMSDRRKAVCAVLKARGVDVARHLRGRSAPGPHALDKARAALLARDTARAVALAPLLRELRDRGESVNAIIGELKRMEIVAPQGGTDLERPNDSSHVSLGERSGADAPRRAPPPFKAGPRIMPLSLKSALLPVVLAAALVIVTSASGASQMWTFCIASAPGGGEVWITDPFASSSDRRALELAMQSTLRREGERVLAQCPQPSSDKVAVVNAQTTAIGFNRKLGAVLHELSEREFPGAIR